MRDDLASRLQAAARWTPPEGWVRMTTIDAHTEGEPLRVIVAGYPALEGDTILERRREARRRYDVLRTALMWEPRGHADMYGCVITPPTTPSADFGVLFLHNEGYSTMCGHGIIAVTTVALETGLVTRTGERTRVRIDTPAGLVTAEGFSDGGRVRRVAFRNVPSFVVARDATVDLDGWGTVRYDLAFGGAFYAFVDAGSLGLTCVPGDLRRLIDAGVAVKQAVRRTMPVHHPYEPDLNFIYGTIFVGPPEAKGAHSRNVCVFADGEVDRSPTGTGVSARAALHYDRGEAGLGESLVIESILGTTFAVCVREVVPFGPYTAVVPEVSGRAWLTGTHTFYIDPEDPLRNGFILR